MANSSVDPLVTFLISTYNRRSVLQRTLAELHEISRRCGFVTETIVVDNASTDGTADLVEAEFCDVTLIRQRKNTGACAKNAGLSASAGAFIVFLDDDSHPTVGSVQRMVQHFLTDHELGAAAFRVTLPDGSEESSAYPSVVIGCGTGFRRTALAQVGGLPTDFFMQAEEYDISLRLLDAGWSIQRFDDLHVRHMKSGTARIPTRTTRLDMRNNLMVATRHFPRRWVVPFAVDWCRRYWWMASEKGPAHQFAAARGLVEGVVRSILPGHRRPIGLTAFETFAMNIAIHRGMDRAIRSSRMRTVVLIDLGKNLLPFYLAAKATGLHIVAIADSSLAAPNRKYHGIPIVTDRDAQSMIFDAAILTNISPAHAAKRGQSWQKSGRKVIDLFDQPGTARKAA